MKFDILHVKNFKQFLNLFLKAAIIHQLLFFISWGAGEPQQSMKYW